MGMGGFCAVWTSCVDRDLVRDRVLAPQHEPEGGGSPGGPGDPLGSNCLLDRRLLRSVFCVHPVPALSAKKTDPSHAGKRSVDAGKAGNSAHECQRNYRLWYRLLYALRLPLFLYGLPGGNFTLWRGALEAGRAI